MKKIVAILLIVLTCPAYIRSMEQPTSPPASPRKFAAPPLYEHISLPELPPLELLEAPPAYSAQQQEDSSEFHEAYYQDYTPLITQEHERTRDFIRGGGQLACKLLRYTHLERVMIATMFLDGDEHETMEDRIERAANITSADPLTPFFVFANADLCDDCLPPTANRYQREELASNFAITGGADTCLMAIQLIRGHPLVPFLRQVQTTCQRLADAKVSLLACAGTVAIEEHEELLGLLREILVEDALVLLVHHNHYVEGSDSDWMPEVITALRDEGHLVRVYLLGRTDVDPIMMQRAFYDLDQRIPCNKTIAQQFEERIDVRNVLPQVELARTLLICVVVATLAGPLAGIMYTFSRLGSPVGMIVSMPIAVFCGAGLLYVLHKYGWPFIVARYLRHYRYA